MLFGHRLDYKISFRKCMSMDKIAELEVRGDVKGLEDIKDEAEATFL